MSDQQALPILYQDQALIAVNKPAGMLVHRSWLDKHETEFVMQKLRDSNRAICIPNSPFRSPDFRCAAVCVKQ